MRNHYVPQFLLKNFASVRGTICVFDKTNGRVFNAAAKNLALECGFYDFPDKAAGDQLEADLARVESTAASTLALVIRDRTFASLNSKSRSEVAELVISLFFRTRSVRQQAEELDRLVQERLRELGRDPNTIKGYSPLKPGDADLIGADLTRAAGSYATLITEKAWVLLEAPAGSHFYLSDSPLTMTNTLNRNPLMSTVGLAVPGIELYLPLTPKLCLAMYCTTLRDWLTENHDTLLARKWVLGKMTRVDDFLIDFARGFRSGLPVTAEPANVIFINSLQVSFSSRFVFSHQPEFDLPKEMIEADEKYRGTVLPILVGKPPSST